MTLRRLFGLWLVAMRNEHMSPVFWALPLLWQALRSMPFVTPEQWRSRMRACGRCDIYDKRTRQCRKDGLGCGCSCPVKFLFAESQCWAREQQISGLGWPEHVT